MSVREAQTLRMRIPSKYKSTSLLHECYNYYILHVQTIPISLIHIGMRLCVYGMRVYQLNGSQLTNELRGSGGRLPIEARLASIVPCFGCRDLG